MKLIRLVILVWLLSLVSIGSAIAYGRSHSEPNELQALGLYSCNGQPCYTGIELNSTTDESAMRILTSMSGFTQSSFFRGVAAPNGPVRGVSIFSNEKSIVFEVDLMFRQGAVPFSAILQHLGPPCAVYPMAVAVDPRYPYTAIVTYPRLAVYVTTYNVNWLIESTSYVSQLDLGGLFLLPSNGQPVDHCRGASDLVRYDWKGLTAYPRP